MIGATGTPGTTAAIRGFHLELPNGFIPLPLDESDFDAGGGLEPLAARVAELFGLPSGDENTLAAAASFADLGAAIGGQGVDYSAVAFYKSPDDPLRPIMVTLTGIAMASDHRTRNEAITGLLEMHSSSDADSVERIKLPVGPAVAVVSEQQSVLTAAGEQFPVLTRQLSAWVPDRDGTTTGVVSVLTNSFQDWERVCTLALDIFDTFGWEPLSG